MKIIEEIYPSPLRAVEADESTRETESLIEQCGATLIATEKPDEWRCIREEAELRLDVLRREEDTMFWLQRLPCLQFDADVALLRDLEEQLRKSEIQKNPLP
jgi:hypothetical protein